LFEVGLNPRFLIAVGLIAGAIIFKDSILKKVDALREKDKEATEV